MIVVQKSDEREKKEKRKQANELVKQKEILKLINESDYFLNLK